MLKPPAGSICASAVVNWDLLLRIHVKVQLVSCSAWCVIEWIPMQCSWTYCCTIILFYGLKISKTVLICWPFRENVNHFPPQIVDRRIKEQANTYKAARDSEFLLKSTLAGARPTWHCDTLRTVINESTLTYWPCNQIRDRNLLQTKEAKVS